ncbi:Glycosyltransferase involved in cell wall bisynthesis [Microbulbifer donghaiensis]|uniref:Glycosyltransferase involved in cell wall bisynthesis n=1 Tax=Microbulbifer donghaiensis TaxID=494016 RepID=A0A1M4W9Z8_9GAMM|nr:glycosyltransferase family 4 protein [Microbulbifer donghaiensis]SHE78037.1 Glycosyltransferase involved in cell wall bisynthesis [Microbulbifer donghaiensis]
MDANRSAPETDSQSSAYSSASSRAEMKQSREQDIRSICHLVASREHGEMEQHVADLSRWQALNTDARISVIAHPRYRYTLHERVKFIPLNTDRSRHHPTLVWRLANHIRAGEYQIAHGHGSKSAQLLAAVQKYTEAQQVITRHNVRHPRDKLASAFSARIAVSRSTVANSRLDWNIIPNGVDVSAKDSEASPEVRLHAAPRILVATRLLRLKGMDALLGALAKLPEIHLTVIGDGPDKVELKRLSEKLGLTDRVNFVGYTDEIAAFIRAADLLLIPSPGETTLYTLIEALLNRCPVASAHSTYAEEYIPPDYLLNNLEPEHLAEKLAFALRDGNKLLCDFAPVFARAANELTLEQMARSTWQVYQKLQP